MAFQARRPGRPSVAAACIVLGLLAATGAGPGSLAKAAKAAKAARAHPAPASGAPVGAGAPAPVLQPLVPTRLVAPGPTRPLTWPAKGEGAVLVGGVGLLGRSLDERPVPIASLTKLMTVEVLLRDHPLSATASGPSVTMTAWDVADWRRTVAEDGSNVEVRAGEVLTERQLLEALLLPSADNLADTVAVWDAGSIAAFVAKMNATAAALGLRATHYADPSGLDPASRSDAVDQARLATDLLADPVVRALVRQPSLPFPLVGRIPNLNPALGVDGIVGLKSGLTDAAGGCLVAAAWRRVGEAPPALVVTVALGQPRQLAGAAAAAESLLAQATARLEPVRLAAPRQVVGWLWVPWTPAPLALDAPPAPTAVVGWPGLVLAESLRPQATSVLGGPVAPGDPPAVLAVTGPDGPLADLPLAAG